MPCSRGSATRIGLTAAFTDKGIQHEAVTRGAFAAAPRSFQIKIYLSSIL